MDSQMHRSCRTENDLPIEWIAQIISFLPLPQKVICKSVSRKWNASADLALLYHEKLIILSPKGEAHSYKPLDKHDVIRFHQKNIQLCIGKPSQRSSPLDYWFNRPDRIGLHEEVMLNSLRPLKCLTKITCSTIDKNAMTNVNNFIALVHSLILYNASSLVVLEIPHLPLPQDVHHPATYSKLQELYCSGMAGLGAAACPRLRRLRTYAVHSFEHLPIDSMRELYFIPPKSSKGPSPYYLDWVKKAPSRLAGILSRLINLRVIKIPGYPGIADDLSQNRLFPDHTGIEILNVQLHSGVHCGSFVEELANRNPGLKDLSFGPGRLDVTADGLAALSRLKGLQFLQISFPIPDPLPHIVNFVRGDSRHCFRRISIRSIRLPDGMKKELKRKREEDFVPKTIKSLTRQEEFPDHRVSIRPDYTGTPGYSLQITSKEYPKNPKTYKFPDSNMYAGNAPPGF